MKIDTIDHEAEVSQYYGKTLKSKADLKTNGAVEKVGLRVVSPSHI